MKKILNLFWIAVILWSCATAQAQITNGVKISALPAATTPLTGNEIVPLDQIHSGTNLTVTASIAQIIAAAIAQDTITSNYFQLVTSNNAATITTASNFLQLEIGTNMTAITTASNSLQLKLGTNTTAIAALAGTVVTNGGSANLTTVTANQVTATNALFRSQNYSMLNLGTNAGTTLTTDLSAASLQFVTLTNQNGNDVHMYLTNAVAGQTVTVFVYHSASASAIYLYLAPNTAQIGAGSYLTFPAGKMALISYYCYGSSVTNVFQSYGLQQN